MRVRLSTPLVVLILGDFVVFAVITVTGFSRHGELSGAGLRLFTTFLPLCLAWGLVAPWLGIFDLSRSARASQLWRPLLAMILAAPLASWLRGAWLNESIPPVFVLVIGAFSALGILIWHALWLSFFGSKAVRPVQHG